MPLENIPTATSPVPTDPRQMFKSTGAASPLDFIKQNTDLMKARPDAAYVNPPVQAAPQVEPAVQPPATPDLIPPVAEVPADEFITVTPEVAAPVEEEISEEGEGPTLKENMKKIKTFFRAEKDEHKKTKDRLSTTQAELEDYKKGKKLPDTLMEQEQELTKLRGMQKVVDLKGSPEYQEKFVAPLEQLQTRQAEILKEYEVPKDQFEKVKLLKSVKAQNEFLSENFDPAAILEIRTLLDKEKQLVTGMEAAHQDADSALVKLIEEGRNARAAQVRGNKEVIKDTLNKSWVNTLEEIKREGKFVELIKSPTDSDYNSRIVDPIIRSAATEASKLMSMLVEDGLTRVRPEIATFISKMTLLAHSSAINAASREKAMAYADELKQNSVRTNARVRPQFGGSTVPSTTPHAEERPRLNPQTMAKQAVGLLNPANRPKK